MTRRVEGIVSVGAGYLLDPGAEVSVSPDSVVRGADGAIIGRVISGEARDGDIYVVMEVEDDPVMEVDEDGAAYSRAPQAVLAPRVSIERTRLG